MVFSSNNFIFCFLPAYLITSWLVPSKWKRYVLLGFSLLFYYFGAGTADTVFFVVLLAVNYGLLQILEKTKEQGKRKIILALALFFDFGFLCYFKYLDFFLSILQLERRLEPADHLQSVPLGISFFTFQTASVLIDCYRFPAAKNNRIQAADFSNCIAAFPKLASGPLVRFRNIEKELKEPRIRKDELEEGFVWFVIGLAFKIILSDPLASVWASIQSIGYESISTMLAWLGAVSFSLQLYFDFHGYSLMALGIGKMAGLTIPRNFLHPYISASVTEFWRRWHITLGAWFRDYVYIPLGGSKHGTGRMVFSLFTVWLLTGLWHGAGWNFILWGIVQFAFILAEKLFLGKYLRKVPILAHLYLILIAVQSWVIFAIEDISAIGTYFLRLYPFLDKEERFVYPYDFVPPVKSLWWVLILAVFFCLPVAEEFFCRHNGKKWIVLIELAVFWICIYLITKNGSNPFMYLAF